MNEVILPNWNIMKLPATASSAKGLTPFRNPMHHFIHQAHLIRADEIYRSASEAYPELAQRHTNVMDFLQEIPDNGGLLAEFRLLKQINNEAAILGGIEDLPPFWEVHEYQEFGISAFNNRLVVASMSESAGRIKATAYIADILEQRFIPFEIIERNTGAAHHYVLMKDDWVDPFTLDYLKFLGRNYSDHVITNMLPRYADHLIHEKGMDSTAALLHARKEIDHLLLEPLAMCVQGLTAIDRTRGDKALRDRFQVRRFAYDPSRMPALDAIYEGLVNELKQFAQIRDNGNVARVVKWRSATTTKEYEISPRNPMNYVSLIHQIARASTEMKSHRQIRNELQAVKSEKADLMNQLATWQRNMAVIQERCKLLEQEYDKLLHGYEETISDLANVYERVIDSVDQRGFRL